MALEYAKYFECNELQASSMWLDKFKKMFGIKEKDISRENKSIFEAVCDDWKSNDLEIF